MMVLIITDSIASVLKEIGVILMEFKPHAHLWDFLDLSGVDTDTQPRSLTLPVYPPSSPYEYNFTKSTLPTEPRKWTLPSVSVC